jgi:ClpP class serine protease
VGSIGVFAVHRDISVGLEKEGIKVSIIKEGRFKMEGNPYEPLTEEARAAIQESVSEAYDMFVKAVARNRGVKAAAVRNGFGEGRMVSAQKAVDLGMADRVSTLNETVERLFGTKLPAGTMKAEVENSDLSLLGEDVPTESGLEPAPEALLDPESSTQVRETDRARLTLAAKAPTYKGVTPMIRELQAQRAVLMDEATALAALADSEKRDFTEEERARFNAIIGEGGEIEQVDAKIAQIVQERAALEEKALSKVAVKDAVKPEGEGEKKTLTRAEYDALSTAEKMAFTRGGGRITE